jgi:hypothetical protein
LRAKRREDWSIPCPKELPPEQFRAVRDLIGEKVKALLAGLVAVFALGFGAARRQGYGPLLVGLGAAVLVIFGKFSLESPFMTYGGTALLVAASIWNARPKRTARADLIELGRVESDP